MLNHQCPMPNAQILNHAVPFELCELLQSSFEEIAPFDECTQLAIDDAALQHPESAVRIHVPHTLVPDRIDNLLDPSRNQIWRLDLVVLDVDDADRQPDLRIQLLEQLQLFVPAPRELQHQMIGVQRI